MCLAFGYIASGGLLLTMLGRPWPMTLTNGSFVLAWIRIMGIPESLGLDVNDPLAFVTGLTFVGPGVHAVPVT